MACVNCGDEDSQHDIDKNDSEMAMILFHLVWFDCVALKVAQLQLSFILCKTLASGTDGDGDAIVLTLVTWFVRFGHRIVSLVATSVSKSTICQSATVFFIF